MYIAWIGRFSILLKFSKTYKFNENSIKIPLKYMGNLSWF